MSRIGIAAISIASFVLMSVTLAKAEEDAPTTQPAKVEPVDYKKLKELMPAALAGVTQSGNEGEKQEVGDWILSKARADYMKPDSDGSDANGSIEITDFGAAPHLVAGMTAWRSVPINIENDEGYTRTVKFKDCPAMQTYVKDGESRTMIILVAERYLVNVETAHLSEDQFKTLTESLPVDKLGKLK